MRKLMALTGALAIASLGLVACGDDDGEDEDQIVEAIEISATSGDPAACTEQQTQNFNEQITGETGEAASGYDIRSPALTPGSPVWRI